jgi:hypothetical protein
MEPSARRLGWDAGAALPAMRTFNRQTWSPRVCVDAAEAL